MSTCIKRGCDRRAFMDEDRCFDHVSGPPLLFWAWFFFCAALSVGTLAVCLWALVTLVGWVTAR